MSTAEKAKAFAVSSRVFAAVLPFLLSSCLALPYGDGEHCCTGGESWFEHPDQPRMPPEQHIELASATVSFAGKTQGIEALPRTGNAVSRGDLKTMVQGAAEPGAILCLRGSALISYDSSTTYGICLEWKPRNHVLNAAGSYPLADAFDITWRNPQITRSNPVQVLAGTVTVLDPGGPEPKPGEAGSWDVVIEAPDLAFEADAASYHSDSWKPPAPAHLALHRFRVSSRWRWQSVPLVCDCGVF